jgi:hypothetical protein
MLHQIQMFENEEINREREVNVNSNFIKKCYSQVLKENNYLRKICESVIGFRPLETSKHRKIESVKTTNNSFIEEKYEPEANLSYITNRYDDLLNITMSEMNGTIKKTKFFDQDLKRNNTKQKLKTPLCYRKKK